MSEKLIGLRNLKADLTGGGCIDSLATDTCVLSPSASKVIVTFISIQHVIIRAATQLVVVRTTQQGIAPVAAEKPIATRSAIDAVIAPCTQKPVIAA